MNGGKNEMAKNRANNKQENTVEKKRKKYSYDYQQ